MRTPDIKTRFTILLACFALGFMIYGAWSIKLLREVRVTGPIYDRIVQSKDLVADILPPPEYIIESYLVTFQLQASSDPAEQERLMQRIQALQAEYDTRHKFWLEQALEPELKQAYLHDAHTPAQAFYGVVQKEFLPAIRKQDKEAATAAMARLHGHYEQHRQAIDRVVDMANKRSATDETAARERIEAASWQMPAILLLSLAAGVGVAVHILRQLFRQLGGDPAAAAELADRIASGDLTAPIRLRPGDSSSLLHAMQEMRDNLALIVSRARSATEAISSASSQIASGNQDLATRTSEQAGSLEQTTASMHGLTSTVEQNAGLAQQANQLADAASETARRGGDVVSQVVQTMGAINASSRRIADIIGVIDGIAFQTNILALNAAVEAARAGEQGRGFAVVASEVRSLAQRSAAAAKEIKELIGDSVQQVVAGSALADQAGATMQDVVASIERVAGIMNDITQASHHQNGGIAQVHDALRQMDAATHQNAALVEQASAAAQSMQAQAGQLVDVVSVFRLNDEAPPARPVATSPAARPDVPRLRAA
ncbi:methyl-accepting chemotaxis protein [Duganella sp. FT92W]|uniref:Methyl-accepting chemotaxis protein n=1 Tax=Pseudoduganella rivuli TaxID=2666085 RepID=A0A7X2ING3_9BURK|nr:methyl-accepting chemotaxis protein [Pseudoduganella rivuli]MRV72802.1 methyl-accepting chemotaxis protein [Pseudoduganella rivuli]